MKKLLFLGAVALFGALNAQSAGFEGTTFISGQAQVSTVNSRAFDAKQTNYTVMPVLGTFVSPTVAIGGGLGVTGSVSETIQNFGGNSLDTKTSTTAFVAMPFVRKYWDLSNKLYLFGQVDVPLYFGKEKTDVTIPSDLQSLFPSGSLNSERNFTSYGVYFRPGLDYFVNNKWTFEATIGAVGYSNMKYENEKSTDQFDFGVNLSSITFGVKYLFK